MAISSWLAAFEPDHNKTGMAPFLKTHGQMPVR
jgi:hypothetical protein